MQFRRWAALFSVTLALTFSLVALPAQAAPSKALSGPARTIDFAHPVRGYPGSGKPHSGFGSPTTGDVTQTGGIQPNANFPSTCYNNVAYNISYGGTDTWTASNGVVKVWVQYQWCPQYSGDPIGINWAYGRSYVLSGCRTEYVGQYGGGELTDPPLGASIWNNSPVNVYDGENFTGYNICSGSYAWDYSLTVSAGHLVNGVVVWYDYGVLMRSSELGEGNYMSVSSPCCF